MNKVLEPTYHNKKSSGSTPKKNSSNSTNELLRSTSANQIRTIRNEDGAHIGKYRFIRTIGKGNFAKVKLGVHVTTNKEVAIKIIDKTQLNGSSRLKLSREVRIMKMLNHPNIVKLYEIIENDKILYLVMEYASGGEVFDYLVAHGRMKEKEARAKFRQILSAVQYCHSKQVVHRDLKAENLLLDNDLNIKIADFGFANEFILGQQLDTFCGSPPYAAPELFQGKKYDGPEVDVWSLGVILYTLVSGSLPFDGQNLRDLRERVLRGKYRIPYYMSTECEQLLRKMLNLNPHKRHTLTTIMNDKWVNLDYSEINRLSPFVEPPVDLNDPIRIERMQQMGFNKEDILRSLKTGKFDNITATYYLLGQDDPVVAGLIDPIDLTPMGSRLSLQQDRRGSGYCSGKSGKNHLHHNHHNNTTITAAPGATTTSTTKGTTTISKMPQTKQLATTSTPTTTTTAVLQHNTKTTTSTSNSRVVTSKTMNLHNTNTTPTADNNTTPVPQQKSSTEVVAVDAAGDIIAKKVLNASSKSVEDNNNTKDSSPCAAGEGSKLQGQIKAETDLDQILHDLIQINNGSSSGQARDRSSVVTNCSIINNRPSTNLVKSGMNITLTSATSPSVTNNNTTSTTTTCTILAVTPTTVSSSSTSSIVISPSGAGQSNSSNCKSANRISIAGPIITTNNSPNQIHPSINNNNDNFNFANPEAAPSPSSGETPTSVSYRQYQPRYKSMMQSQQTPSSLSYCVQRQSFQPQSTHGPNITSTSSTNASSTNDVLADVAPSSNLPSVAAKFTQDVTLNELLKQESPTKQNQHPLPSQQDNLSFVRPEILYNSLRTATDCSTAAAVAKESSPGAGGTIMGDTNFPRFTMERSTINTVPGATDATPASQHTVPSNIDNVPAVTTQLNKHHQQPAPTIRFLSRLGLKLNSSGAGSNNKPSRPYSQIVGPSVSLTTQSSTVSSTSTNKNTADAAEESQSNNSSLCSSRISQMDANSDNNKVKPRSLRFTWNMKTTSSLHPDVMLERLMEVLQRNSYHFRRHGNHTGNHGGGGSGKYLLVCTYTPPASANEEAGTTNQSNLNKHLIIQWEAEICKLPRLALHGIRFKRISGSSIGFKDIVSRINMQLVLQ